eukprot:1137899-Pelagomonas_calceolata.AAC.2
MIRNRQSSFTACNHLPCVSLSLQVACASCSAMRALLQFLSNMRGREIRSVQRRSYIASAGRANDLKSTSVY